MFNFIPPTVPNNIFVIGAGGTGGRLIPLLAQFLRSITHGKTPTGWVNDPKIWLVDDDTVEQKNLLRQNFIQSDVNKPKAQVLAERYSRAFDVTITPLIRRVTSDHKGMREFAQEVTQLHNSIMGPDARSGWSDIIRNSIIVICVDSAQARRDILQTFTYDGINQSTFFIDSGNEDDFGQVSFFNPVVIYDSGDYNNLPEYKKVPKLVPTTVDIHVMPMDCEFYENLVDTPAQGSCADLNQTLAINAMMATTIMGIIQNYYYRKPFTYNAMSLSLKGGSFTTFNTFTNFKSKAVPQSLLSSRLGTSYGAATSLTKMPGFYRNVYKEINTYAKELNSKIALLEKKKLEAEAKAREVAETAAREERLRKRKEAEVAEAAAAEAYQKRVLEEAARNGEEVKETAPSIPVPESFTNPPPLTPTPRRPRRVVELSAT